jgi:hypothetical protein
LSGRPPITADEFSQTKFNDTASIDTTFRGASSMHLTPTALPLDRWVCLELRVDWGAAPAGHVRVLVNDTELTHTPRDRRPSTWPRHRPRRRSCGWMKS